MSAEIDYYYTQRDAFDPQQAEMLGRKEVRASAASSAAVTAVTPRGSAAVVPQMLSALAAGCNGEEDSEDDDDEVIIITTAITDRKIAGTRRVNRSKYIVAPALGGNMMAPQQQQTVFPVCALSLTPLPPLGSRTRRPDVCQYPSAHAPACFDSAAH
jgi:hypothetical protein